MIDSMTSTRERIGTLDVVIAVVASVLAAVYMYTEAVSDDFDFGILAVPVFVGITVPLLWRRVAPLEASAAMLAVLLLHAVLFPEGIRCGIALPVMLLFAFSIGARLDRNRALIGLALTLGIGLAVCTTDGPTGATIGAMAFVGPVTIAIWGVGRLVHSRGHMVSELQARTTELRETRDERARLEVATDRARLSGELDALLQRRLAELAKLADGADDLDPAAATATLAQIEHESRRTLEEMREVVGVLRNDAAPVSPQPTLTHLEALLVRAKGAGARLDVEGSPRALPAGVELSAYRIVEQLLDALQDAPGVEVGVRFADDALELKVAGPVRRRGEEQIERARERARLQSGTFESITQGGRAEAVVSLPIFATV